MIPRVPSIRCWLFAVCALGATAANAQLASRSPFMPAQSGNSAAPTAGAPLEFRGSMTTSEGTVFRIYDPARKSGVWVKANEKSSDLDVLVKQHDDGQNTLTIEYQGKTLVLAGRESKVVSSGSAGQIVPPPVAAPAVANVSPAVTQTVVMNPTPADEQRRLDAVAAEVARRRALREQATQQQTQGGAPQSAPAVQAPPAAPALQQQGPPGAFRGRGGNYQSR